MSSEITYLITGANRGIGKQLVTFLLSRPNTTVIAGNRDPEHETSKSLASLPTASGSKLIVVKIDASSFTDPTAAAESLKFSGITKIDVVVANAGIIRHFGPAISTPLEEIRSHFEINSLAPLALIQAFWPLLSASKSPKFFVVSTNIASIGIMEKVPFPALSYGISKVAANYTIRKLHYENENLTAVALHPGWVKTDMGHFAATANGMSESDVPVTAEDSAAGLLKQIDAATKENLSGEFVSYDGSIVPW